MFGWKRQRKDVEEPEESALECAALGSSPAAVVCEPSAADHPSSSLASSLCSEADAAAACASIELATHRQQPLEQASVRSKTAFFEALIRSNTTAHVLCTAEGTHQHFFPSSGSGSEEHLHAGASGSATAHDDVMLLLDGIGGYGEEEATEDSWQDYSEVHMVLRMPRPRPVAQLPSPGSGKYGSVEEMEQLIEQMQAALDLKERQRKAAADAYTRRSSECENLMRVVRELTESRAKAVSQRAVLAEKYSELQQEYHRMLRIADLSRTVSKENMAKTSRTRSELRQVQSELHATKRDAHSLNEKNKKVRVENALLKEKLTLLERLDFEQHQESEVKKHFTRYRLAETY